MRICDICFSIIEGQDDICTECRGRKGAKELIEDNGLSDERIIERFLCLMKIRNNNIENLVAELKKRSVKYDRI